MIKKSLPDAPKLYVLRENKSACLLFSLSSEFYFIGDKIKDEKSSSLKTNDRLKLDQYVALNHLRKKGKPRCKLSYKLSKEEDGYDTLLDISMHPKLIQLKDFIGGIHHCVTVVGKWMFDSNFTFALPLTKDNLDYCFINDNETKGINGYKVVL